MMSVATVMLPLFVSCSSHSRGVSFTSKLDAVDAFVAQGDTGAALKELKSLSKEAFSFFERLGVYKRFVSLGEEKLAEKYLRSSLKKLPENTELSAVYASLLLRRGEVEKALKVSRCLEETRYAGLYAECVLRDVLKTSAGPQKTTVEPKTTSSPFKSKDLCHIYELAWKTTKNPLWLINAASVYMLNGSFSEAILLYPGSLKNAHEALFWGTIFYDASNYSRASEALSQGCGKSEDKEELLKVSALLSDSYIMLDAEDEAQNVREEMLSFARENKMQGNLIPVLGINSALYMRQHGETAEENKILLELLDSYPSYEPALAAYGELSLDSLNAPEEDEVYASLRKAGLKTLGMEKRDAVPVVTPEDALSRIDKAPEKDAKLVVLKEKLTSKINYSLSDQSYVARVWSVLEANRLENGSYAPEIVQWATDTLIRHGSLADAYEFFFSNMKALHGNDFVCHEKPELLTLWELECAAWFYAKGTGLTVNTLSNADIAERLYSYIVEEYGPRTPVAKNSWQNNAVINAYVNLGVIYSSTGREADALSVLNKANGRAVDAGLKAEILYRMAVIQNAMGNTTSTVKLLKDALKLDGNHNRSRLLLKKISVQ